MAEAGVDLVAAAEEASAAAAEALVASAAEWAAEAALVEVGSEVGRTKWEERSGKLEVGR